jgi:glycosyltransferase involved in cell wall biosynthesis
VKDVTVSVIIATRNRCALLADTLAALGAQDWPHDRLEVVVADNGSTDGTRQVVEQWARAQTSVAVRYLFVARPGKSRAVNSAMEAASGGVFALTDDDVRPDREWVRSIVESMDETGSDFLAGRVLPLWDAPPPKWMSPALYGVLAIPDNGERRLPIGASGTLQVVPIGANMAVRRSAVEQTGGFRVDLGKLEGSLRTGEDHEFFLRLRSAGLSGVYEPRAVVHHRVPADRLTRGYFRRWLYQNGRDSARVQSLHPAGERRLFGVPRYLWRHALSDLGAALVGLITVNQARAFAAFTRLAWMTGYVRQAWFGGTETVPMAAMEANT